MTVLRITKKSLLNEEITGMVCSVHSVLSLLLQNSDLVEVFCSFLLVCWYFCFRY